MICINSSKKPFFWPDTLPAPFAGWEDGPGWPDTWHRRERSSVPSIVLHVASEKLFKIGKAWILLPERCPFLHMNGIKVSNEKANNLLREGCSLNAHGGGKQRSDLTYHPRSVPRNLHEISLSAVEFHHSRGTARCRASIPSRNLSFATICGPGQSYRLAKLHFLLALVLHFPPFLGGAFSRSSHRSQIKRGLGFAPFPLGTRAVNLPDLFPPLSAIPRNDTIRL